MHAKFHRVFNRNRIMAQLSPQINGFIPENRPGTLGFPALLGYRIEEISGYFLDLKNRVFYTVFPASCITASNSKNPQ